MRSLRSGSLRSGPSLESYRSLFLRGSECLVRLTKNHPTSSELDQTTLTLLFFHFVDNLKTKTKSNVPVANINSLTYPTAEYESLFLKNREQNSTPGQKKPLESWVMTHESRVVEIVRNNRLFWWLIIKITNKTQSEDADDSQESHQASSWSSRPCSSLKWIKLQKLRLCS